VVGGWITLHNEELNNLYASSNIITHMKPRTMRWAKHVTRMEWIRNEYEILFGKPKGKRPLGRRGRRWENDIRMDLREIGLEGVAQYRDW